tara:strand:- start:1382 stop:1624 length:243 start_codon:yes stop_codon:yes gene_type:complete
MTIIWYSTDEDAGHWQDFVEFTDSEGEYEASEEEVDEAIAKVMRDLQTDHLHYSVTHGGKSYFASVSICRPIVEPDTPEG